MPPQNEFTRATFQIEEVRVDKTDDGKITARGYAAMFEKLSLPIFNFKEKIRSGAFKKSLAENNVRALWNHNPDIVLGSTKANTLRLQEDEKGLRFELDLPDTQAGRDAAVLISRGDVEGMSFGFRTITQEWDEKDPKNIVRTLIDLDLREISPTAFPAYPQTKVKVRSVDDDYAEYSQHQNESSEIAERENELNLKLRGIAAL
jgi:HK97 family phage prohead protease